MLCRRCFPMNRARRRRAGWSRPRHRQNDRGPSRRQPWLSRIRFRSRAGSILCHRTASCRRDFPAVSSTSPTRWDSHAIPSAGKTVQNRLIARGVHFEYGSVATGSSVCGCPVDVPGGIQNHSGRGIPSVACSAETMQHCVRAAGVNLEDRAAAVVIDVASGATSAVKSCSVEVAGRISGHTALWPPSI